MRGANGEVENICERCGKGKVALVVVDSVYSQDGKTVDFKDEFMRCDHCGREFYTREQSLARSRAITAALREVEGFLSPDDIRKTRLRYDMSLPDFEKALGLGKNTVGRWERGTVPPTSAANFGLWVAAQHPHVFKEWAALRGITVKPQLKRIAVGATSAAPSHPAVSNLTWGRSDAAATVTASADPATSQSAPSLSLVGENT